MSLLEQQNALARLLTDPDFRTEFLSDPHATGRGLGLQENEIEEMLAVARSDLDVLAKALTFKRLREVEKLLPVTKRTAGDEFRRLFLEFAPTFNPKTVRKHYEDAVAFSRFIEARVGRRPARDAARFERTRICFFNENRAVAFCRNRYDLEKISGSADDMPRLRRIGIAVWLRFGKRVFHFLI